MQYLEGRLCLIADSGARALLRTLLDPNPAKRPAAGALVDMEGKHFEFLKGSGQQRQQG